MMMVSKTVLALAAAVSLVSASSVDVSSRGSKDACAKIGGKTWVSPSEVRDCFKSFSVIDEEKSNILEVIKKTLGFHTSVNYQISAPEPFADEVHEDLIADLARIEGSKYKSDYDLHIEFSRALKRLNDGHCVWINACYDSLFIGYLPTPLVLLTDKKGKQSIHIATEAYTVSTATFPEAQIKVWEKALPWGVSLESLSGAEVILINGKNPWDAVNANTEINGGYQAFGTRQNSFFSSYRITAAGWVYVLGNFAQQGLPLSDSVILTLKREGDWVPITVKLPYQSQFSSSATKFTDTESWRDGNCKAVDGTNGVNYYDSSETATEGEGTISRFRQAKAGKATKHLLNMFLDSIAAEDITLPEELTPPNPVAGSDADVGFYMLDDKKTGVLALGSFSGGEYDQLLTATLDGLVELKSQGATQLIVDVNNNGGGYICLAHWLHRIIVGPLDTSEPNAGLDTEVRGGELAQAIVDVIISNPDLDPDLNLLYNPINWRNTQNEFFNATEDFFEPLVEKTINGHDDAFSQKFGNECQPEAFTIDPPTEALFSPDKVAIVTNGRCASSCSLFSIAMNKHYGTKTVVLGGKSDVEQDYCGTVGGQSTDFSTMDSEVKTAGLKNHTLAPPDLIVNGVQGITWRLGFGIDSPDEPEEWQEHKADVNFPLTAETANNPVAIWKEVVKTVF